VNQRLSLAKDGKAHGGKAKVRPGINVSPVISPDGNTLYTVSWTHFSSRNAYLVAQPGVHDVITVDIVWIGIPNSVVVDIAGAVGNERAIHVGIAV